MNYEQYVKDHVSEKDWKKLQEMGINLDTEVIAGLWPDLVNIWERERVEIPFLCRLLPKNPKVLNVATGSGATTIGLIAYGIVKEPDIVSNEIDKEFTRVAKSEAERYGIALNLTSYDWRDLDKYPETFDAVLCLGNSLTMLLDTDDQKRALENFRNMLNPDGMLIIDERNYGKLLKETQKKTPFPGNIIYSGIDKVSETIIYNSGKLMILEFEHEKKGTAHIPVYAFGIGELWSSLIETGFQDITISGDYKRNFNHADTDFFTYVCKI